MWISCSLNWQEMTSWFVIICNEINVSVSNTLHCFFCFKGIPVYPSPNPSDAMAGDIIGKFLVFFPHHFTVFPCVTIFDCFGSACSLVEIYVVILPLLVFIFWRDFVLARSSSYCHVHIKQFSRLVSGTVMEQNKFDQPPENICRRDWPSCLVLLWTDSSRLWHVQCVRCFAA